MAENDQSELERFIAENMTVMDAGAFLANIGEEIRMYERIELEATFCSHGVVNVDTFAKNLFREAKASLGLKARKSGCAYVTNIIAPVVVNQYNKGKNLISPVGNHQYNGEWSGAIVLLGCGLKKKEEPEYEKGIVQVAE